ncbi:MAG: divalent-cation tolerance protein CutA [Hyphomicrobiaceae bacterium]|nr:divalent-cation tolerance protein CutA [Hyphomicrobiaceae bacterium]
MDENDKPILVYTTFPDRDVANAVARALVEDRLAACVNLLGPMTSVYRWDGAIETATETVGIVKTRAGLAEAVQVRIRGLHPYANPALLVLRTDGGAAEFIDWIVAETDGATRSP